ncbi:MAG: YfaZ family protein [Deltaproteobacteria bacterium]|nr:YfaZ family protein [Deltaproteobacteria bacterium]
MSLRILLTMFFCLMATIAAAGSVDIGFNDESFQIGYEHPLTPDNYGTAVANGRFLYNGDEETRLGSLGLDFIGNPGNVPGLGLGVGTKFYAGSTDPDTDFVNLAIGLRGSYILPQLRGFGVAGHLYYAPKVFSFQDSERLLESQVRLTYAVLPKAKLFVGYQNIRLDIDNRNDSRAIDNAVRIGFVGSF